MKSAEDLDFLTTEEVMVKLKCSRSYLYKKETQEKLGASRMGNRVKWPVEGIRKYKEQTRVVVVPKKVEKKAVSPKKIVTRHNLW